ncbi:4334_t:CDS:2 [Entrophospora sp. SA101]|nr:4334_t:CDS:2 [Entrophospora sp. SA101]
MTNAVRKKDPSKDWEEFEKEYDSDEDPNIDDSWGDWNEEELQPTLCLFCETISPSTKDTKFHMKDIHGFDLLKIKKNMGLDFYQTIILINYIRHKTLNNSCMACNQSFENSEKLLEHMKQENCFIKVPDLKDLKPKKASVKVGRNYNLQLYTIVK